MTGWHRREVIAGAAALGASSLALARATSSDRSAQAFLLAFPVFEMARLAAGPRGGINLVRHAVKLSDHTSRAVTCPNNDTLYSSFWFDLTGGPIDVDLPLDADRYVSLEIMSAFTDNVAVVSAANSPRVAQRLRIVGPWHRKVRADGRRVIHVPTNDGWMLGRTGVDGPCDLAAAAAVQHRILFAPAPGNRPVVPRTVMPTRADDPQNLHAVVSETLARSDPRDPLVVRAQRFAAFISQKSEWEAGVTRARADMAVGLAHRSKLVGGWNWPDPAIGRFGSDDLFRAATAPSGIGALMNSEAVYLTAVADANGRPLGADGRYRFIIPAVGLPAKAFWSLTMYEQEPDGRLFLIDNPVARYSVGNRTAGLVRSPDGTTTVFVQPDSPQGAMANWLPSPRGPFRAMLRLYWPDVNVQQGRWMPPSLQSI